MIYIMYTCKKMNSDVARSEIQFKGSCIDSDTGTRLEVFKYYLNMLSYAYKDYL